MTIHFVKQFSFFGQDRGLGENTPLASWPNATATQASFLSYLVGVGTETFEGLPVGSTGPLPIVFPGAGTATLQGNVEVLSGFVGFGRYPISPDNWLQTSTGFNIIFSELVSAFGFFGVDIGDFGGDLTLEFSLGSGATKNFALSEVVGTPGGTVMYFGYINSDDPFTGVTFGNTAGGVDGFGFDDMTIGSPEQVRPPSVPDGGATLGLLGLAMIGLHCARKKLKG